MSEVENILTHAEQQCRQRGTQFTDKRRKVLSSLLQSEHALSAYELVEQYKTLFNETLPAMTVYRILEFLEKEQLVHKLDLANRFVPCRHITCDHRHEVSQFLICTNCHRVREITIRKSTLSALEGSVEKAGFRLVSPQLEMKCLCELCS